MASQQVVDNDGKTGAGSRSVRMAALGLLFLIIVSTASLVLRTYLHDVVDIDQWRKFEQQPMWMVAYAVLLLVILMLPFSPTSPILALGIVLFGPTTTFLIGYTTGIAAAVASYGIGTFMKEEISKRFGAKRVAFSRAIHRRYGVFVLVLVLRLVPNPVYDLVGYLCGMLGVSFRIYLVASMIGGAVLLAVFCFSGQVFVK